MIQILLQKLIDIILKSRKCIAQLKRHYQILELIVSNVECDESFVFFFYSHFVECVYDVDFSESFCLRESCQRLVHQKNEISTLYNYLVKRSIIDAKFEFIFRFLNQ
jgi:hypothetical protein